MQRSVTLGIEQLLSRAVGLNIPSVGNAVIERAVRERMTRCAVDDTEQYLARLLDDGPELQALIEEVVVSETWFFRNHEALLKMADLLTRDWPLTKRGTLRRILSVPCATGEEPYSIAMALAERGITPKEAQIDAIDVSQRALAIAERALYGPNSFRGEMATVCDRYTRRAAHGIELVPEIRHWVRFSQGNLVAPSFHPLASSYDVIFCRNVLIYLERAAQVHVLTVLHQLLVPNGYLFLGPAEAVLAAECGFRTIEPTAAFVCQKVPRELWRAREERPAIKVPSQPLLRLTQPERPKVRAVASPKPVTPSVIESAPPRLPHVAAALDASTNITTERTPLGRAHRLADAGHLTEAADLCADYVREHGPTADAYYLLGLVQDARGGSAQAVNYYRKALFLDPNHADASAQLAVHAQRAGDAAGAERFRARLQRIERRQGL